MAATRVLKNAPRHVLAQADGTPLHPPWRLHQQAHARDHRGRLVPVTITCLNPLTFSTTPVARVAPAAAVAASPDAATVQPEVASARGQPGPPDNGIPA